MPPALSRFTLRSYPKKLNSKKYLFLYNKKPLKSTVNDSNEFVASSRLGCFVHDSRNNRYALSCLHLSTAPQFFIDSDTTHVFMRWDTDDTNDQFVHLSSKAYGTSKSYSSYGVDIGLYGPIVCPMSRNPNKQRINVVDVSGVKIGQKCYVNRAGGQISGQVVKYDYGGFLVDKISAPNRYDLGKIVYLQSDDSQSEYLNAIGLIRGFTHINEERVAACVYLRPCVDFLEEKLGKLQLFDYPFLPPEYDAEYDANLTDDTNLDYNDDEKEKLAKTCSTKVLFAGKSGAGKSSLVKTLKDDDKKMVRPNERTRVINFHNWTPKELKTDGKQMSAILADLGGHKSYETTVKFFSSNDANNVNVIAHKIDDGDYKSSYQWLKTLVYMSHQCKYLFVLTQVDAIANPERVKSLCTKFKRIMCKFLDEDIQNLTIMAEELKDDKFKNVLATFKALKEGIANKDGNLKRVFCITCNDGCENPEVLDLDETTAFKQKLVGICKAGFILIPEVYEKFYVRIGRVGLKSVSDMSEESNAARSVVSLKKTEEETGNESSILTPPGTSDQTESTAESNVGVVGLKSVSDMSEEINAASNVVSLKKTEEETGNESSISDSVSDSEGTGHKSDEVELHYTTWEVAEKIFNEIKQECDSTDDETLENCLTKLNALGMLFWFNFTFESRKIIYNDIPSFIVMVRSLFDHNLEEDDSLKWNSLTPKQKGIFSRREDVYTKHHYNKIFEEGIMTKEFLKVLLMRYAFHAHVKTVIDLFCHLDIWFRVNEETIFCPWFLKSTGEKAGITEFLKWIIPSSKVALSRVLQFSGYLTRPLFHIFVVALHKRIQLNLKIIDKKHIWDNGMCVHLGNIAVALVHEPNRKIYAIVKANSTKYKSLRDLWNFLMILNDTLQEITEKECSDAVEAIGLLCPVCTSRNKAFCRHVICVANMVKSDKFTMPPICGIFDDQIDSSCFNSPNVEVDCGHGTPKKGTQGVSKLFLPPFRRGEYNLAEKKEDDFVKKLGQLLDINFKTEEPCKYMLGSKSRVTLSFDESENLKSDSTKHSDKKTDLTTCDSPPLKRCRHGFAGETNRPSYRMTISKQDQKKCDNLEKYICQIKFGSSCATGFILGFFPIASNKNRPRCLIMTSWHILNDLKQALVISPHTCVVVFNKQGPGSPAIPATFKVKGLYNQKQSGNPVGDSDLDYLLIKLNWEDELYNALKDAATYGGLYHYIEDSPATHRLFLIGHPEGRYLQVDNLEIKTKSDMLDQVKVKQKTNTLDVQKGYNLSYLQASDLNTDHFLFYTCYSYHGSSGSPLFEFPDDSGEIRLVGIQKDGIYATNPSPKGGEQCLFGIGVKLSKVREHLLVMAPELFNK